MKKFGIFEFWRLRVDPTYHEVSGKQSPFLAKELSNDPFHSISVDRTANFFRHQDSNLKFWLRFFSQRDGKMREKDFFQIISWKWRRPTECVSSVFDATKHSDRQDFSSSFGSHVSANGFFYGAGRYASHQTLMQYGLAEIIFLCVRIKFFAG